MNIACVIPEANCPACFELLEMTQEVRGKHVPRPGDLTMCCYCGTFMKFTDTFGVRLLDEMEKLQLESHPHWSGLKEMSEMARGIAKRHRHKK